jgi:anti-anti-sigma factor
MSDADKIELTSLAGLTLTGNEPQKAKRLDIKIQQALGAKKGDLVTIKLIGSLDTSSAPELDKALQPVISCGTKDVVFDLSELKFISSAGLRIFAIIRKSCKERGGQASFVNLQPQIHEVFEIIKALPGVAVFKDIGEFDRYLAARQRSYETQR